VILRDLDDGEGAFSKLPPVGSEMERQIHAHFTRVTVLLTVRDIFQRCGFSC
jgi:hypothetical protein